MLFNVVFMSFLKKNWAWILVVLLAFLPLINIFSFVSFNFSNSDFDMILFDDYEVPEHIAEKIGFDIVPGVKVTIHSTGEWAIRWMIAVLMITPFRIVFGTKSNLYVRQAMGISCGVYVMLHGFFFMYHEGFFAMFTEVNLVLAVLASVIIMILTLTSNRRAMKYFKKRWKKMHRIVYWAAVLSIMHVVLLGEGWMLYGILFSLGLIVRFGPVREWFDARKFKLAKAL